MSGGPDTRSGVPIVGLILAPVLLVALGGLAYVLVTAQQAGRETIEAYVGRVRAGESVSAAVGGAEASTLTALFAGSTRVSIGNFQGQAGTACFWTTLYGDRSQSVRFVLDTDAGRVVAASAERDCTCPDPDTHAPCRLSSSP